jgi:hypothetical protein
LDNQERLDRSPSRLPVGLGGGCFENSPDDHPSRIPDLIRELPHANPLLADTNAIELR